MKKNLVLTIISLIFFCCSTVGVSDKNIATIQIELYKRHDEQTAGEPSSIPLTKIKPGERYQLQMVVYTKEGTKIERPSIHDFTFKSPNNSFIFFEKKFDDTLCFTANPDSFYFADGKKFQLNISVNNNPFKDVEMTWDIDWGAASVFNYSGRDGARPEVNFTLAALFSSGTDGYDGANGENGVFCHFDIAYYDVKDGASHSKAKTVVIYDRIRGNLYFTKIETQIIFNTEGGNGSDGLDAAPYKNGQPRGQGGNGGNGGNGGDIIINLHDKTDLLDYIQVKQNGGRGGAGGKGSIDPESEDTQSTDGFPGSNGRQGRLIINRFGSFSGLFTNVAHPRFKKSHLYY